MLDNIGERVRKARASAGLTQIELAQRMAEQFGVEVSNVHLNRIENKKGEALPSVTLLVAITKALNVSSDYLLGLPSGTTNIELEEQIEELQKQIELLESRLKGGQRRTRTTRTINIIDALPPSVQDEIISYVDEVSLRHQRLQREQERVALCAKILTDNGLLNDEIRESLGITTISESESLLPTTPSIYFIAAIESQRIKIGFSAYPEKRINTLMTSSPYQLEVIKVISGNQDDERQLHQRFAHLRNHREWFTDCEELREYINQLT